MFNSRYHVLSLFLFVAALVTGNPMGAQVLFPGYHGFRDANGIFSRSESATRVATAIRTYRGGYGHTVLPTPSGAIVAGTYGAGGDCCDPWLVWLDTHGNPIQKLIYDSDELAGANNIQSTPDGGFIMSVEGLNMMAVKLDADGNIEWAKNYGEGGYTHTRVIVTSADDYLLIGGTALEDNGVYLNGRAMRLDVDGNVLWDKVIGRYDVNEYFTSAAVAHNGNNIIAGMTGGNYWVLEIDQSGNVVWEKMYGGTYEDDAWTITPIQDRFYMVVGSSESFAAGGLRNWWAIVITETGNVVWQYSLGGPDAEDPNIVIETTDGGAMIGGGTGSFGAGMSDLWLVKFDSRGQIEWQKTYGTWRTEHAWHIWELPAGGYVVVGDSYSYPDTYDVWLMAIDGNGNVQYGDCGAVGDTFVTPFQTTAMVNLPGSSVTDENIRVSLITPNVVDQTYSIDDCAPGN